MYAQCHGVTLAEAVAAIAQLAGLAAWSIPPAREGQAEA